MSGRMVSLAAALATAVFGQLTLGAEYRFTDLSAAFGPAGVIHIPIAINDSGVIAGSYEQTHDRRFRHSFVYDGTFRDLGSLRPDANTYATAMNNAGQIVGTVTLGGEGRGFLYSNGMMSDLGALPGSIATRPWAINNGGQIVGTRALSQAGPVRAIRWQNGVLSEMPTPSPIDRVHVNAINDAGVIVGHFHVSTDPIITRPFVYQDGAATELPTLGGNEAYATDINASGLIFGSAVTPAGQSHAVLWRDGQIVDLGSIGGDAAALSLNDAGVGVGWSQNLPFPDAYRAVLYRDGQAIDLNTLVDLDPKLTLVRAFAINNAGWIVGDARYDRGIYKPADHVAFLLTPIPEPASAGLLAAAAAGGMLLRPRRGHGCNKH